MATAIHKMLERNQAANDLALQCVLRISGLIGVGMLSSARRTLETYLLYLRRSADLTMADSPNRLVAGCADAVAECVEKSWQDFRNHIQIGLLTRDEALIWVDRIDKALFGVHPGKP